MSEGSSSRPALDPKIAAHVSDSYPHNSDFRVIGDKLKPRWKLRRRLTPVRALYPDTLTDLLDLSSSKGYFVLEAATRAECRRTLGIDVHEPDIEASRGVADHLNLKKARFECQTLRGLSESIDEFGGPFRTVLLLNTYPYHFFGSDRAEATAPDHGELFRLLASVAADRLIFSNRTKFSALPRHIVARAEEQGLTERYDPDQIREGAAPYFEIEEQRPIKKIPLWLLRRK